MLPLGFQLDGVDVLVLGAGAVGVKKARQLCDVGARVSIVATHISPDVPANVHRVERRGYRPGDLRGFSLVVSAIGQRETNDEIVREARERRIWLNVVDDPERSSFYFMALHREGDVTIAVTTDGASPTLAQVLRDYLSQRLPGNLAAVAEGLRHERERVHRRGGSTEGLEWRTRVLELLGDTNGA